MVRYGETCVITEDLMRTIAVYMNDELREKLHNKLAPCSSETFLREYVRLVPDFEDLLFKEFGIEEV